MTTMLTDAHTSESHIPLMLAKMSTMRLSIIVSFMRPLTTMAVTTTTIVIAGDMVTTTIRMTRVRRSPITWSRGTGAICTTLTIR